MGELSARWSTLREHITQRAYWNSTARFNTVPAGRRSGKTELAKRKLVTRALRGTEFDTPRFFAGAPTRDQAKRIFWDDLKLLVPSQFIYGRPMETELLIRLVNGAELCVVGMDKPERIEGVPWDGGVLDEYGNMRPTAWPQNVRPALSDRLGWCDMIGVPEGRNHYYDLDSDARAQMLIHEDKSEWASYHWISADILPPEEIAAAKRDLDELTYQQEYEASFLNFTGRVYYKFSDHRSKARLEYNPDAPLLFCFDFNVDPGVAAVAQEMSLPSGLDGTGVIGEVWIPNNSNTERVCDKLIQDWGDHRDKIKCYGDASGGARGTAKVQGSDWDLIVQKLRPKFGERLHIDVPPANPPVRSRVNAVNSRLCSTTGDVRLMVDPARAPKVVRDFEGVRWIEGGAGEIDKKKDPMLTHISDAIGYYVAKVFPVRRAVTGAHKLKGMR